MIQDVNNEYAISSRSRVSSKGRVIGPAISLDNPVDNVQFSGKSEGEDRSFSLWGAVKKFGAGLISPITGLFSSPKAFITGALTMAALGGLCIAAPAFGSVMVTGGLLLGAYQGVKALGQIATAKDGKDVENAFEEVGAATSTIGLTVATGRMALKSTGMPAAAEASNMSMIQATWANVKNTPAAIVEGFSTLFSGKSIANLRGVWAALRGSKEAVVPAEVAADEAVLSTRTGPPSGTQPVVVKDPPPRTAALPDPVPSASVVITPKQTLPPVVQTALDGGDVVALQTLYKTADASTKALIEARLGELGAPIEAVVVETVPRPTPSSVVEPLPVTAQRPRFVGMGEYELPVAEFVGEIGQMNMTGTGVGGNMTVTIPGKGQIVINRSNINGANLSVESADLAVKVRPGGRAMPNEGTIKFRTRVPVNANEEIVILVEDGYQIRIGADGKVSRQVLPSDISPPRRLGLKTIGDYKMAPYEEFVGETYITNKATGEPVNVMVVRSNTSTGAEVYKMIRPDGKQLGYTDIRLCSEGPMGHIDFLSDVAHFKQSGYCGTRSWGQYGHSSDFAYSPRVYVEMMESPYSGSYRGVGERLHQLAVERSIQVGGEGRVTLSASYNSHGFHYKTGFRTQSPNVTHALETDQRILAILEDAKLKGVTPNTRDLHQFGMYLPEEGVNAMKVRIQGKQILEDVGPLVPADWAPPVVTVKQPLPTVALNEPPVLKTLIADVPPNQPQVVLVEPQQVLPGSTSRSVPLVDRPVVARGRQSLISPKLRQQLEAGQTTSRTVKGSRKGIPNGNRSPYGPDGVGATSRRPDPVARNLPKPKKVTNPPTAVEELPPSQVVIQEPVTPVVVQEPLPQTLSFEPLPQVKVPLTDPLPQPILADTVAVPQPRRVMSRFIDGLKKRVGLDKRTPAPRGGNRGNGGIPYGNRSPYGPQGYNGR